MQRSRFVTSTTLQDGTGLFYSFYTLTLLAVEAQRVDRARALLADPATHANARGFKRLTALFARHGFLVPDGHDEGAVLEDEYRTHQSGGNVLALTVLPTLACNFACTYCYQGPTHSESMPREVEDALVVFATERVRHGGGLSVTWYGGEPLLRRDAIERMSRAFVDLCRERSARYDASIVTNGYLLNGDTARWLRSLDVTQAQVTLDGPAAVHDARRPLAAGGGTFDRIVGNLAEAVDVLQVTVRVNLDASNHAFFPSLLDALEAAGIADRVGFYPGRTASIAATCADLASSCLGVDEFSLASLEASLELGRRRLPDFSHPSPRYGPCGATAGNSFVVTPSGGLVTCWNYVNDPDNYVGHLLEPATPAMRRRSREWASYSPFTLECGQCEVLPICMSACPYVYREKGELSCIGWKLHPDEHLLNHYRVETLRQQVQVAAGLSDLHEALSHRAAEGTAAAD